MSINPLSSSSSMTLLEGVAEGELLEDGEGLEGEFLHILRDSDTAVSKKHNEEANEHIHMGNSIPISSSPVSAGKKAPQHQAFIKKQNNFINKNSMDSMILKNHPIHQEVNSIPAHGLETVGPGEPYGRNEQTRNSFSRDIQARNMFLKGDVHSIQKKEMQEPNVGETTNSSFRLLSSSPLHPPSLSSLSQSLGPNVLDLTQVEFVDAKNLIQEIVNYIEVKRFSQTGKFDVVVQHNNLGRFELSAFRGEGNKINMNIMAESFQGHQFFVKHKVELSRALDKIGVKLGDLKLVETQGTVFKNELLGSREEGGQRSDAFSRSEYYEDADSRRRRQLWEEYRRRYY